MIFFSCTVKFLEVLRPFISVLPEVSKPERKVSLSSRSPCKRSVSFFFVFIVKLSVFCWRQLESELMFGYVRLVYVYIRVWLPSLDTVTRDFSINPPSVSYRSSLERKYYGRRLRCLSFLSAARLVKSYVIDRKLRIIDILHDWPFVATAILQKANSKELSSLWFSCDRSNKRVNLTLSLYVDSFVWHYVVGFSWSLLLDASDFSFEQR